MSLATVVREYFKKMISKTGSGMKVLVVDNETMGIVSAVYTQSEILQKEVFLVEKLQGGEAQESMLHMKAMCFIRPTPDNFALLKRHLRNPKYGEYHIFFSNMVRDGALQELADADEGELVKQVQEFYADYLPLDASHLIVPVPSPQLCFFPMGADPGAQQRLRDRAIEGLVSLMLSLKRRPIIRFQRSSDICRFVAKDFFHICYQKESALFDFRRSSGSTLLLLVDRLDDPVTPLLTQWTYQAMVHELVGIANHRVDLRHVPKVAKDQAEVVLAPEQDPFFKDHMFDNYGDLGVSVKNLVDDFQKQSKSNQNISSIADMQRFVESYPEFRSKSGNVSKHVTILSELNRIIDARHLMAVSGCEQEMACKSEAKEHYAEVTQLLADPNIAESETIRLVLLFALRYEKDAPRLVSQLVDKLQDLGLAREKTSLVNGILRVAGAERRTGDLYGTKTFSARASKFASSLKGVDNVYTQHQPLLVQTLENLGKCKMKDADYPFEGPTMPAKERPAEVVVFMLGGTTYEEAKAVHFHNQQEGGMKVVLGGTSVHNSTTFLQHLSECLKAPMGGGMGF